MIVLHNEVDQMVYSMFRITTVVTRHLSQDHATATMTSLPLTQTTPRASPQANSFHPIVANQLEKTLWPAMAAQGQHSRMLPESSLHKMGTRGPGQSVTTKNLLPPPLQLDDCPRSQKDLSQGSLDEGTCRGHNGGFLDNGSGSRRHREWALIRPCIKYDSKTHSNGSQHH